MKYTNFGNTGIKVSRLGFGAMRLPTGDGGALDLDSGAALIRLGIDLGINYIDSAWVYHNGRSEEAVGQAIKGYDRSKLYISTKKGVESADGKAWREGLEIQLRRLDTDYIDFYHFHNIFWEKFENFAVKPGGPLDEAHRALDEGIIRHLSFSSHDTPANIIRLIDSGEFASMLVQYNLLFRLNETAIAHAASKGLGVAIMGPVMGGRLVMGERLVPSGRQTVPHLALRFVLSNPNVSLTLSGMGTPEMVRENVATASSGDFQLSKEDLWDVAELHNRVEPLKELYCTGCGYCMPCPNDVDIPGSLLILNYVRLYSYKVGFISSLGMQDTRPGNCIECGECLDECPQNIPIPDKLRELVELLASEGQD